MRADPYTREERRWAAAVKVWSVWNHDTFGFGEDRDPPLVSRFYSTREECEAELARQRAAEANNTFLSLWMREDVLADIMDRAEVSPLQVRELLRRGP